MFLFTNLYKLWLPICMFLRILGSTLQKFIFCNMNCMYLHPSSLPSLSLLSLSLLSLSPSFRNKTKQSYIWELLVSTRSLRALVLHTPLVPHLGDFCACVFLVGTGVSELKIKVSTATALSSLQPSSNQVFDKWWKEAVNWEGKRIRISAQIHVFCGKKKVAVSCRKI